MGRGGRVRKAGPDLREAGPGPAGRRKAGGGAAEPEEGAARGGAARSGYARRAVQTAGGKRGGPTRTRAGVATARHPWGRGGGSCLEHPAAASVPSPPPPARPWPGVQVGPSVRAFAFQVQGQRRPEGGLSCPLAPLRRTPPAPRPPPFGGVLGPGPWEGPRGTRGAKRRPAETVNHLPAGSTSGSKALRLTLHFQKPEFGKVPQFQD